MPKFYKIRNLAYERQEKGKNKEKESIDDLVRWKEVG